MCRCRLIVRSNAAARIAVLSATFIEARKITDKRHGYRGRVSLINLGNGSDKARIKLTPDQLTWPEVQQLPESELGQNRKSSMRVNVSAVHPITDLAVIVGLYTRRLNPWALIIGWAGGLVSGTWMVASLG